MTASGLRRPRQQVSRRDRRGRGQRGPLAWPPVPAMVTRAERFDQLVLDAVSRVELRLEARGGRLDGVEFAVEDVPPSDPAPWEPAEVPLSRLFPAERGTPTRIVVYRRPVETRATDPGELALLVDELVVEQVAAHVGVQPDDLDEGYDSDRG